MSYGLFAFLEILRLPTRYNRFVKGDSLVSSTRRRKDRVYEKWFKKQYCASACFKETFAAKNPSCAELVSLETNTRYSTGRWL